MRILSMPFCEIPSANVETNAMMIALMIPVLVELESCRVKRQANKNADIKKAEEPVNVF